MWAQEQDIGCCLFNPANIGSSAEKLPSSSRSHRRHRNDDHLLLMQLKSLLLLSIVSPILPPRDKVNDQASVEAADRDDLFQGNIDGGGLASP